jgi:hypothetical protein
MVKFTKRGVKTTIEIPGELWKKAKVLATEEPGGLRGVMVRALREFIEKGGRHGRKG